MRLSIPGSAVTGLLLVATLGAQPPFAWWKSEEFRKDLGLSGDQSVKIDSIFQATLPTLRQGKEELDRQEAELSRLLVANADEAQVTRQIDTVESARASLNKTRTLMLFHMRQVLSAEQRTKLKALHHKWVQDHPRHLGDAQDDLPRRGAPPKK